MSAAPRGLAVIAAVITTCAAPGVGAASPLEMFGFGARSSALAGTGVASDASYEAVYLNPSGLARVSRKKATVGFLDGNFELEMDGRETRTESARGLVVGGELPIPLGGSMKDRLGMGFGFYVPAQAIARVRAPFPGTPSYVVLENRTHVIALQVAIGVKVRRDLDVGVGVIALAALQGGIHVSTDAAGRFTTTSEQRLLTRLAPVVGARWHVRDGLDAGAVIRASSRSDYDIAVTTDIGDVVPIQLPPIRIAGNAQFDPLSVAAEVAWRPSPDLLVSGQLQYQHWSAFPLPTLNPVSGSPVQEQPDFHDTLNPRVSVERTSTHGAMDLALRTGTWFAMTPAPKATGRQSFFDNHRLVLSGGVGVSWPHSRVPLFLDGWLQVHQLLPRRQTKADGIPFDVIDTGGRIFAGGVTAGVAL